MEVWKESIMQEALKEKTKHVGQREWRNGAARTLLFRVLKRERFVKL